MVEHGIKPQLTPLIFLEYVSPWSVPKNGYPSSLVRLYPTNYRKSHALRSPLTLNFADGDVWSYGEAKMIRETTGVQGVMSARGLLANPVRLFMLIPKCLPHTDQFINRQALFAGYDAAPDHAISVRLLATVQSHAPSAHKTLTMCHPGISQLDLLSLALSTEFHPTVNSVHSPIRSHAQAHRIHARIRPPITPTSHLPSITKIISTMRYRTIAKGSYRRNSDNSHCSRTLSLFV